MRKRIITPAYKENTPAETDWLNLEKIVEVEITSEDTAHPIEAALIPDRTSGWRAAEPGEQTIRLLFDHPQALHRIRLDFEEPHAERTQQYVLRWSPDGGHTYQEIVRQQWNFSPSGSTREIQDFRVELPAVTVLELSIIPDISGEDALASLVQLQLA